MKQTVKNILFQVVSAYSGGVDFDILIPPSPEMGDYSTNIAFKIGGKPMVTAEEIKSKLEKDPELHKMFRHISIIVPGFINFYLSDQFLKESLGDMLGGKDKLGNGSGNGKKINIEFISANPTGPLTVGNARAASYGDTLANILKEAGCAVTKEYYLNDAGVQVNKLGLSVAKRYLQLQGKDVGFEEGLYQGEYVKEIAKSLEMEIESKNLDANIEALADFCRDKAVEMMVKKAKETTKKIGIEFDVWFKESELYASGEVDLALERLENAGVIEKKDGAVWLKYGDGQEAVLVKNDGNKTYLMGDIAYTLNKLEKRKFDKAINIWGTDHHGDVPRLLAAIETLGHKDELEIILHQLVMLKQKDERLKISKRAGNLVLLDDLINDVDKDAVRFFFLSKDLNTHMEFDVDLAREQSKKNPVFYIQYAFARLSSIFEKLKTQSQSLEFNKENLSLLEKKEELVLMHTMAKFPDVIENIAKTYQVHHLATYTVDLATQFHQFYEKHKVIQDDSDLQNARAVLSQGVYNLLKNCLDLMGLSTPEKM